MSASLWAKDDSNSLGAVVALADLFNAAYCYTLCMLDKLYTWGRNRLGGAVVLVGGRAGGRACSIVACALF